MKSYEGDFLPNAPAMGAVKMERRPHERPVYPVDAETRKQIETILSQPGLRPFKHWPMVWTTADLHEQPFLWLSSGHVSINRTILRHPSVAALVLRHILELDVWLHDLPSEGFLDTKVGVSLCAVRVAAFFHRSMSDCDRECCLEILPSWLVTAFFWSLADDWPETQPVGPELLSNLGGLLGQSDAFAASANLIGKSVRSLGQAVVLAQPLEDLLVTGGDERLMTIQTPIQKKYHFSPRPKPATIGFSSTTASNISPEAFESVEFDRQSLIVSSLGRDDSSVFFNVAEQIRQELRHQFLPHGADRNDMILSPSGTDAELIALALMLNKTDRPVVNILIAPEETGSGVEWAAEGKYFNHQTPLGKRVERNETIPGFPSGRVTVVKIPLREPDGTPIGMNTVNAQVTALVEAEIAGEHHVLLHVLDASKTGLGGPDLECAIRLKDHFPNHIDVVVDACQFRFESFVLEKYLDLGFMVILTGSKFYSGPPFSAVLILPRATDTPWERTVALPEGCGDFFSRCEWPESFTLVRTALTVEFNLGLLLRWRAALFEMTRFNRISPDRKNMIIEDFGTGIQRLIHSEERLLMIPCQVFDRGIKTAEWDRLPTIFTFAVWVNSAPGERRLLYLEELSRVFFLLNERIVCGCTDCDEDSRNRSLRSFLIGQPVQIGPQGLDRQQLGALRLSIGAEIVSRIAGSECSTTRPTDRMEYELASVRECLEKIILLADRLYGSQTITNCGIMNHESIRTIAR